MKKIRYPRIAFELLEAVSAIVKDGLGIIIYHGYPEMDWYPGRRTTENCAELTLSYAKVHVFGRSEVAEQISEFDIRMQITRSFAESNPDSLACYLVNVWYKRDGGEVKRAKYSYAVWDKKVQYHGPLIGDVPYPIRF